MFVQKHTETIEYIKKQPTFLKKYKFYTSITQEFLGFRMLKLQGIIFIWIRTNMEIFKSSLVLLVLVYFKKFQLKTLSQASSKSVP